MRLASNLKAAALLGLVAAAAMVPLYGDPRQTPVTHTEWARLLLRALDMEDAARATTQASEVFGALSWKNSLAFGADRYAEAENVRRLEDGVVVAEGGIAELAYPLAIVQRGDYRLRVRIKGDADAPASIELTPAAQVEAVKTFPVVPPSISGWVDAGSTYLTPGAYRARVLLPPGSQLDRLEVSPPCGSAIEPPGGWQPTAVARTSDVAVTMIQALEAEADLPPAAIPIEVTGESFGLERGARATLADTGSLDRLWVRGGPGGLQAIVFVDVPDAGLYTVSSFGVLGSGQSWTGDSCRKSVVCGARLAGASEPGWHPLMTAQFAAGRHSFSVTLASGAGVERLRLERRKDTAEDYLVALKRLGFDPGPDGPITREKAVEAMAFIAAKVKASPRGDCGDVGLDTTVLSADAGAPGPAPLPSGGSIPPETGTASDPIGSPVIPPQLPASPDQP